MMKSKQTMALSSLIHGKFLNEVFYDKAVILAAVHFSTRNIQLSRDLGRALGRSYVKVRL